MMNSAEIANKLRYYIETGDNRKVEELLGDINDTKTIKEVESKFIKHPGRDPVNLAIDYREEKIATYLVEKGFSIDYLYQWLDQQCDQWCYYDHGSDRCPAEYDAAENADKKNLYKLKNLIDSIKQGKHKPGDGLPVQLIQNQVPHPPRTPKSTKHPKMDKQPQSSGNLKKKTPADEARECLKKYQPDGRPYVSKTGDTLFHLYIDKPKVYMYVFANAGIPVNIQNSDGDTALHLAVREELPEAVEALIQCGADLTARNLMGQTPVDEADNGIRTLLEHFQLGIIGAVLLQKSRVLGKFLANSWCSTRSIVKEGKNLLELAASRAENSKAATSCVRILQDFRKTSQLIHAVLCEDVEETRKILESERGWTINVRFRDNKGKTLLSHAIESNNFDIVKLLVEHGAKIDQIRVREGVKSDVTLPLFQKALKPHINQEIAKYLHTKMSVSEHLEKDCEGSTAILRAMEEDCSPKFISWLIKATEGRCLVDRNQDGWTPKQMATEMDSEDLMKVIDKYITQNLQCIPQFSSNYCMKNDIVPIKDEQSGKSLIELTQEQDKYNLKKWLNFQEVESNGIQLFVACARGNREDVERLYDANYRDQNGYTSLIRAVVFQQYDVCSYLCTTRPALKTLADNCNRYPLHYAYALPERFNQPFIRLLLEKNPEEQERKVDKDGRLPAEYQDIRDTVEIQKMLYDARTLDVYGKRGSPLGAWPDGAKTIPPDADEMPLL